MHNYGQRYCPIARASELFAERWTPIIVRNLLLGCSTFGELLEGAPGLSRSVLAQRLKELERNGIVTTAPLPRRRGSRYTLTEAGWELHVVCDALGRWGARWLEAAPKELDPGIVLWAVANCMDGNALPATRVVVRFDIRGHPTFWLLVQQPKAELCRTHPGAEEDLVVTTDHQTLARWHMGDMSLRQATSGGLMTIAGPPRLVRSFARWGGQSPFADVPPSRRRGLQPVDERNSSSARANSRRTASMS